MVHNPTYKTIRGPAPREPCGSFRPVKPILRAYVSDSLLNSLRAAKNRDSSFFAVVDQARAKLHPSAYPHLFAKIRRVRPAGRNGLVPTRVQYLSKLTGYAPLKSLPLQSEIAWVTAQIIESLGKLQSHVSYSQRLTRALSYGSCSEAITILDEHLARHGETLWNIEARIGILSLMDSPSERVNAYLDSRVTVDGSVADYFAILFADLYDEDTSLGGFHRRVSDHLKKLRRDDFRNFIEIRLLGFGQVSRNALSDFVRISSSFGVIDTYEAIVHVLPLSFFERVDSKANRTLSDALAGLTTLGDIRINRPQSVLRIDDASVLSTHIDATDDSSWEFHPDFNRAAALALYSREETLRAEISSADMDVISKKLVEALLPINEKSVELIFTYEQLQTLISKYKFLPWYQSARSWADGIFLPVAGEIGYLLYRASCSFQSGQYSDLDSLTHSLPWSTIYSGLGGDSARYNKNAKILAARANENHINALEKYPWPLMYGNSLADIAAASNVEDLARMLKICVEIAITSTGSQTFLPFGYIFNGKESWDDLAIFDSIDLVIGLYFSSLGERESRKRFLLEFACKKMLSTKEKGVPAAILHTSPSGDTRIHFILREILAAKNLRLVGWLRSIEDLEKFRIDVCSAMLDLDKEFKDRYIAETMEILQAQDLRKAERDVDSARINVDREGIKKWAEKTYKEEFLLAKKTRTTKMAPSLEEIELNFAQQAYLDEAHPNSSMTQNLKDPIFVIAQAIFRKCFWKEDDGLDHFLSLRIRHGSFAGYLRAPLEQVNLVGNGIAKQDSKAKHWESELTRSNLHSLRSYVIALQTFQSSYDAIVEDFRSELLQINTSTKPNGLFVPGLPKAVWDGYHSDWESARNFDIFFDLVWQAFQGSLDSSLKIVIGAIDQKILLGSEMLLDGLRRDVNSCGLDDLDRAIVISSLNEGGRALQEAVKSVKKWFEVKRDPISDTELTLRQVLELALRLFKKIRPNFAIEFQPLDIAGSVFFSGENISRVTDALFIILDNVYKHSGWEDHARVDLTLQWLKDSDRTGRIYISATSELSPSKSATEVDTRLADVKKTMYSGEHRSALVNEGRTGLIKLAWLAFNGKQPGQVDFSLSNEREFNVKVWMGFGFTHITRGEHHGA